MVFKLWYDDHWWSMMNFWKVHRSAFISLLKHFLGFKQKHLSVSGAPSRTLFKLVLVLYWLSPIRSPNRVTTLHENSQEKGFTDKILQTNHTNLHTCLLSGHCFMSACLSLYCTFISCVFTTYIKIRKGVQSKWENQIVEPAGSNKRRFRPNTQKVTCPARETKQKRCKWQRHNQAPD